MSAADGKAAMAAHAARGNLTAAIKAEEARRAREEGAARKLALSARDREAARTFGAEEK